jgi:hypothetical protein
MEGDEEPTGLERQGWYGLFKVKGKGVGTSYSDRSNE